MVRVTKCCCCIQIKTGTYIIGSLHVLGLVAGIFRLQLLTITLEIFTGCTFLYMVYRDSERNRLLYFTAYCCYAVILAVIRTIFVLWQSDESQKV